MKTKIVRRKGSYYGILYNESGKEVFKTRAAADPYGATRQLARQIEANAGPKAITLPPHPRSVRPRPVAPGGSGPLPCCGA